MDNKLTIRDCTDEAGNFDDEKFNAYRKQRDSFLDESTEFSTKNFVELVLNLQKKCQKINGFILKVFSRLRKR